MFTTPPDGGFRPPGEAPGGIRPPGEFRGADALIAALERAGVDTVFGIPGGASLPIYDALLRLARSATS